MSGERIKDKTRKAIIADRACGESIRAIAKKYAVSTTSVQRIIRESPELTQLVTQKKAENTADILAYMESKRNAVCDIIEVGLAVLPDKIQTAKSASEVTTALGTLIDKFTALYPGKPKDNADTMTLAEKMAAIREAARTIDH